MTAARWQELKSILADAVECGSDNERERLIAAACGAQADLAAELSSFLRYAKETADDQWLGGHFASLDLKASWTRHARSLCWHPKQRRILNLGY